jgi:ATP-dependent DNA ligase
MTLLADLVAASRRTAETSKRLEKIRELAACLRLVTPGEVPIAIAYLSGETRQGKLGVSFATLNAAGAAAPATQPSLTLADVDCALAVLADIKGKGAAARRTEGLRELFAKATADERDFLERLIVGELRQGALRGLMLEAIAAAAALPVADVRRAAMSAGNLGEVARAALGEGLSAAEFPKHRISPADSDGGSREWTMYLRPEIVVEIAFNEIQDSSQYPGRLALRFARVKGYRPDKRPDEADTIDAVRQLYHAQVHAGGPS